MQTITILGDGPLGHAVAAAAHERGRPASVFGRPAESGHDPAAFRDAQVVIDASRGPAVADNVRAALDAGVCRFVIATTDWLDQRAGVDAVLRERAASAVVAANFSLGVALFARLIETATDLFGAIDGFDPYLVEWHRRGKADRPSGTAIDLGRRIAERHPALSTPDDLELVSIRAGASPGMHLVGFDAAGETVELRLTARDRTAYAHGILAAAEWLGRDARQPGIQPFDPVVDDLLRRPSIAA